MGQWGMNPWFFGFAGGRSSISRGGNLHQPTCPNHSSRPSSQPPIAPATPAAHLPRPPSRPTIPAALSPIRGFSCFFITLYLRRVYWFICIGGFTGLPFFWACSSYGFIQDSPYIFPVGVFSYYFLLPFPSYLRLWNVFLFLLTALGLFLLLLTAFFLLLLWAFSFFYLRLCKKFSLLLLPAYFHSASSLLPIYYRCTSNVLPLNY